MIWIIFRLYEETAQFEEIKSSQNLGNEVKKVFICISVIIFTLFFIFIKRHFKIMYWIAESGKLQSIRAQEDLELFF